MSLINNKYKIIEKIGEGSFGSIYKGENIRTNEFVAIKIENIQNNYKLLKNESIIYQYLINTTGIPNVKWFGKDANNYYMVLNLLGESLQKIKNTKGSFSLKLVLQIGIQIITILKTIHDKGLVHRDIKPDNFLLSKDTKNKQLYIIDFGFCKTFMNNGVHIKMRSTNSIIGSLMYASINSHNLVELSRRDDLESLGYMLIYFYKCQLEWQSAEESNKIISMKQNIINDETIPEILRDYLKYVRGLEFEEIPNYNLIIDMYKSEIIV
jgi:casein kinase I family protein HRR25